MNALIRFYFNTRDPEEMDDDEFYKMWAQLEFALQFDGKMIKTEIKQG